jgi:hypothetical protein
MHICHSSQSDICLRLIHTRRGCKCHPPCITKFICVLASGKSYTGRCSYVCARISTMSERATTHAAQFHSLTQLNIMQHISRKHSERARNNDSALSLSLVSFYEGWILHFFLSADIYVFPYFIDVPRRSAGVLCIN